MANQTVSRKASARREVWKPFLHLIKNTKLPYFWLIILVFFNLFGAQLSLLFPDATQKILAGDVRINTILSMIIILFLRCVVGAVQLFLANLSKAKVTRSFRRSMLRTTLRLPVPYFDKNMASQIISRNTEDTTTLSTLLGDTIPAIPSYIYSFAGTFVILFSYNWRLVLLALVIIPMVWFTYFLEGRVNFKWQNRLQSRLADLTGYLSEVLVNIPLVKVFVKEKTEERKGHENIDEIYQTKKKAAVISTAVTFLTSAQNTVQTIICVLGGSYLVSHEHITIDQWIAFYMYSSTLLANYWRVGGVWSVAKSAQGAARRISEISMEPGEDRGGGVQVPERPGDLSFRNVTFRYDRDTILKDVSITFPQGKVTALVGRSGAGKSTVFGLLERFYLPESGQVTLDGRNAQDYDLAGWRRAIGYVPQSSPMFSGTIRENMTYGLDRTVSEEDLVRAAKDANIYDFIRASEQGFDTQVGERGGKLSGGQRQRVAIARALLKDPKILLLDEATSSLDPESKAEVEKALDRLKAGRTTIIVAHDLRSVQDADQIVVLDGGRVSASGDHETLMRENGLYRSLKELQNGGPALAGV